jgi:hypothetical protein
MLLTRVPDELFGRGIPPAQEAHGFAISLDVAEPWGGGRVAGRVESRSAKQTSRQVSVSVSCLAAWLDVAPELVGQKSLFRPEALWHLRTRFPVWLDEEVWVERWEIGDLASRNWLPFSIDLPQELPRAIEGTFAAFRYRVEARRSRGIGHDVASLPLLLSEPRPVPTVRIETTPVGSWRLLERRNEDERDGAGGPCSIRFEERRP